MPTRSAAAPRSRRKADQPSPWQIAARTLIAVVVGYGLVWTLTAALSLGLFRAGWINRPDAADVATNLAFLAYPAVILWAFAARRLWLAAAVPIAIGLAFGLLALVLQL